MSVTNLQTKEVDTLKEIEKIQFEDEEFFIASGVVKSINIQNESGLGKLRLENAQNNELKKLFATPSYSVSATATSVNEGSTAFFTITTENVTAGTIFAYSLTGDGITSADLTLHHDYGSRPEVWPSSAVTLTGSATVSSGGQATVEVGLMTDGLTEGLETLTINLQGQSASIAVLDTSTKIAGTKNLQLGSYEGNESFSFI